MCNVAAGKANIERSVPNRFALLDPAIYQDPPFLEPHCSCQAPLSQHLELRTFIYQDPP
ncbi:hypothetical protein K440DRAFT_156437 [Wilcoxina mikolae CBS 423.85]|nr:hypothetical protein K440DRAFT_156437 [Wilcoxina mikolae CBS 423.85]